MRRKITNSFRRPDFQTFLLFALCFSLLSACKKTKSDNEMGHLQHFDPGNLSPVRLINSAGYAHVTVNGKNLTNFIGRRVPPPKEFYDTHDPFWSQGYPGTDYFPIDGYLGREWRIPQQLFRENGRLDMFLYDPNGAGGSSTGKFGLTIYKTDQQPVDYYLGAKEDGYLKVPRDETPSTKPGHFKIRIINLSGQMGSSGGNASGPWRDLSGPQTLTYADGTPVNPKTSNVNYSNPVSDYIELPYGKYQFRVLNSTGWQLPGADQGLDLDPPTASNELGFLHPNYLVHAPIHSYQPGGCYTILVYPFLFKFVNKLSPYEMGQEYQNGFRVIEDTRTPANTQFCQAQGFNALPGTDLRIRFNGKDPGEKLAYGTASAYQILQPGDYKIEALDLKGNNLASVHYSFKSNQNYTVCAFPAVDGSARLSIAVNDLSGEANVTDNGQDNGAYYGRTPNNYPFMKRFINFCPDIPYLTFTRGNGLSLGGAEVTNLQPGQPVLNSPYVRGGFQEETIYELLPYRSAPGLVPGQWADDIQELKSRDFIANKSLYTNLGWELPVHEPGYYTVAVIGRVGPDVPAAHKAKMVIIKHNK